MKKLKALWMMMLFLLLLCGGLPPTAAQSNSDPCGSATNFDIWLNCKVEQIAAAQINQSETTKQVETPSIAENTTSLVDQSQAPDLFGVALNLAGLNSESGDNDSSSGTVTTSAYALYAAAAKEDALDPAFYLRHPNLRRFSFTVGRVIPDEDAADQKRATVLGFKVLVINKRDASIPRNRAKLAIIANHLLPAASVDFANTASEVQDYLYMELAPSLSLPTPATTASKFQFVNVDLGPNFSATLNQLKEEQLKRVDDIITRRIASRVALTQNVRRTVEEIRRAPQLSFTFQSKSREKDGDDEYRGGLTFDYGLYRRINLTLNATFDYQDSKIIGGDKRGGRVAAETNFHLTPVKNLFGGKDPFMFSIATEGKWMTDTKPAYTGQLKLNIPILDGINFPISLSFANQRELIKESTVRGRFGFTFDFAKLVKGFRN